MRRSLTPRLRPRVQLNLWHHVLADQKEIAFHEIKEDISIFFLSMLETGVCVNPTSRHSRQVRFMVNGGLALIIQYSVPDNSRY